MEGGTGLFTDITCNVIGGIENTEIDVQGAELMRLSNALPIFKWVREFWKAGLWGAVKSPLPPPASRVIVTPQQCEGYPVGTCTGVRAEGSCTREQLQSVCSLDVVTVLPATFS